MTKIEWVKNFDGTQGRTWNPVTGCSPVSEGCRNCYARRMARRLAGRHGYPEYPHHFDVTLRSDRLDVPLRRKKPTTYFVCSMSDLFHEDVPFEFITQVFDVMCDARSQHHIFQVLTKRPERITPWLNWVAEYWNGNSPFSVDWEVLGYAANVHLGITAEDQPTADERIETLRNISAVVRFVSFEPLLSEVIVGRFVKGSIYDRWSGIHWAICGAETGPGARPMHPDWARSLRDQCVMAGIPFFFKGWGEFAPEDHWRQFTMKQRNRKGAVYSFDDKPFPINQRMYKVGKKTAGRLLDGREWNELPDGRV